MSMAVNARTQQAFQSSEAVQNEPGGKGASTFRLKKLIRQPLIEIGDDVFDILDTDR